MFNILIWADLYILDRIFNPLAIKLYKRFGVGNFAVAKILIMLGTAFLIFFVYLLIAGKTAVSDPFFAAFFCLVQFWYASSGLKAAVENEAKWKSKSYKLPENFRDASRSEVYDRRLFLFLTAVVGLLNTVRVLTFPDQSADELYQVAGWLLILSGYYFLGCTPPSAHYREEEKVQGKLAHATNRG